VCRGVGAGTILTQVRGAGVLVVAVVVLLTVGRDMILLDLVQYVGICYIRGYRDIIFGRIRFHRNIWVRFHAYIRFQFLMVVHVIE
jgi:hypothetical protein